MKMYHAMIAILAAVALPAAAKPAHPDFTGLWLLQTGEKRAVPKEVEGLLTPEGKARMDARNAQIAAGFPQSEGHVRCEPAGMPQMMTAPFAIQIMQDKDRIVLNAEVANLPRTILFRASHPGPDDLDPSWNGHSIARWQGKALIVDTIGFNDEEALDFNFDPPVWRTPALHLGEVWSLEDGGKTLVDRMILDDPKTFTRPVTVTYRYARRPKDEALMEKVCEVDSKALGAFEKAYPREPKYKHPF